MFVKTVMAVISMKTRIKCSECWPGLFLEPQDCFKFLEQNCRSVKLHEEGVV